MKELLLKSILTKKLKKKKSLAYANLKIQNGSIV